MNEKFSFVPFIALFMEKTNQSLNFWQEVILLNQDFTRSFLLSTIDMTIAAAENIRAVKNIKSNEKDDGIAVATPCIFIKD